MKSQILNSLNAALALGLVGAAGSAWATVETTSPVYVGAATTIQGNGGSGYRYTMFSQRMVQPIAYAGKISNLQGTTVTDSSATWADNQFGTGGTAAYVEFDNGVMVDISATSGSSHSLTLAGSLTGVAAIGDSYRIRPHTTIASLFGTNNETGLKSGTTPVLADNIILQLPQSQQTVTIFYLDAGSFKGWYDTGGNPSANMILYPEQGLMVKRIVPGDVTLFSCGPVKNGVTVAPVEAGFNLVGTIKSLTTLTLSTLGLYTGDTATGISSGSTPALCDNVLIAKPDGSTTTYFYLKVGSFEGWYDTAGNPSASLPIAPGSAFIIKRQAANGAFNWTIPAE